jgi:ATP-dependent helicase/DNAse subunit B
MPITLITGPANAGKAQLLLEATRGHAAHGLDPLLVVPTRADVDGYRLELAEAGLVFGVRVERFGGLIGEVIARAVRGPGTACGLLCREPLSAAMRERVLGELAARHWPARGASGRGMARALGELVLELQAARIGPQRLLEAIDAIRQMPGGPGEVQRRRAAAARMLDLADVYSRYREALSTLGRLDPELRATAALDELRRAPELWRQTPVLLYGFDDLTALQLDAIETLGVIVDAPVTVSLAYEAGREAFAGRALAFQALAPLAHEHKVLPSRAEHYAPCSRQALHHLERSLFEPLDGLEPIASDGAVLLLEGGGERAELELVAVEIRALLDHGFKPEEIALVHRSPAAAGALIVEVLASFEIPCALEYRRPFSHTAVGGALLGLLACACGGEGALPAGEPGDLLRWLRAPGLLERPELADRLEAQIRRGGARTAAQARALWEAERWPLEEIDRVKQAARNGPQALTVQLSDELGRLYWAPRMRLAAVLEDRERDEAQALAVGVRTLDELGELACADPELAGGAAGVAHALTALEIVSGEPPGAGMVPVLGPLELRARRVRALFLCGLQEGVFPAAASPGPMLDEEDRRLLAEASQLRMPAREDQLNAERYLMYATVSRPEELLVLSWHAGNDDERDTPASLFVEDVSDLFEEQLGRRCRHRALGAVDWPGAGEPPPGAGKPEPGAGEPRPGAGEPPPGWAARERALQGPRLPPAPVEPLRGERALSTLGAQHTWSASSLERWARCPVGWMVERLLGAGGLEPDPEPLARGALAHEVLRDVLEGLRVQTGSAMLTPERLGLARELLGRALSEHAEHHELSVEPERVPGVARRLERDLERYLEHAAANAGSLVPSHLELPFGFPEVEGSLPALDLGDGLRLRGRIDRVDVGSDGGAVVYDYKGERAPRAQAWADERSFQVAVYMRAVQQLLDLDVLGGFYQPLRGRDLRARGALRAGSGLQLRCMESDVLEPEELERLVSETLALARQASNEAARGALEARPESCGFGGSGCMYPAICRCEH